MGRAGSLPSVPEEFVGDVMSTSWSLADIVGIADDAMQQRRAFDLPIGSAMRHATRVAQNASLSTATELLMLCPRRVVVVVDVRHRPLGVITPCEVTAALSKHPDQLSSMSALQAAAFSGPVLPERTRLGVAARVLAREDRDFALVVDDSGALAGVLMATDVLDAQARAAGRPY